MKVLMVSKALVAATYRQKLKELAKLGDDVIAVVPGEWREDGQSRRFEPGDNDGYTLIVSPVRLNGHFHLHYYPKLPNLIRNLRPDVVHLDEEPYNLATFLGVRAAKRSGIPSLFYTWQNILRRYPLPFRSMEQQVYHKSQRAIAGSKEAARVLREKGYGKPISIIPQFGVDPILFSPGSHPDRPFTVGFPNRLIPAKAPFLLLDAFRSLPMETSLTFVGDGPLRTELAERILREGLSSRVVIESPVPSIQMPGLLRSFDVVVLPSLTTPRWKEQFGRVLVEAMSCGIPVVGSDSGEIPEVVGDAGLIVPEGDARALGKALTLVHSDRTLRMDLAQRGRQRVLDHFTHARVAEQTHQTYVSVDGSHT